MPGGPAYLSRTSTCGSGNEAVVGRPPTGGHPGAMSRRNVRHQRDTQLRWFVLCVAGYSERCEGGVSNSEPQGRHTIRCRPAPSFLMGVYTDPGGVSSVVRRQCHPLYRDCLYSDTIPPLSVGSIDQTPVIGYLISSNSCITMYTEMFV